MRYGAVTSRDLERLGTWSPREVLRYRARVFLGFGEVRERWFPFMYRGVRWAEDNYPGKSYTVDEPKDKR